MKHHLIPAIYGLVFVVGMLVHRPRREGKTLRKFVDAIALSGMSVKQVAGALEYDISQFNKILRGEPGFKLDVERFEDTLPYPVAKLWVPSLAEIYLQTHMQQSADVLNDEQRSA